jgi:hypothetical protein
MGASVRFENAITLVLKVYLPTTGEISAVIYVDGEAVAAEDIAITTDKDIAGVYYIECTSLVVADAYEEVTCTIFVDDVKTLEITDSVADYAVRRLATEANGGSTNDNARKLYATFMMFADSAKAYLNSQTPDQE